eukprot:Rmarinus@m.28190
MFDVSSERPRLVYTFSVALFETIMSPECSVFLIKVLVLLLIYCSTSFSCAVSNKFHLTTRSAFETSCHTLQACEDTDCECTSAAVRGCQDLISGCDEHKIASLTTSLCHAKTVKLVSIFVPRLF